VLVLRDEIQYSAANSWAIVTMARKKN